MGSNFYSEEGYLPLLCSTLPWSWFTELNKFSLFASDYVMVSHLLHLDLRRSLMSGFRNLFHHLNQRSPRRCLVFCLHLGLCFGLCHLLDRSICREVLCRFVVLGWYILKVYTLINLISWLLIHQYSSNSLWYSSNHFINSWFNSPTILSSYYCPAPISPTIRPSKQVIYSPLTSFHSSFHHYSIVVPTFSLLFVIIWLECLLKDLFFGQCWCRIFDSWRL